MSNKHNRKCDKNLLLVVTRQNVKRRKERIYGAAKKKPEEAEN